MQVSMEAERKRAFVGSKEPNYLAQPDAPRLTASFADPASAPELQALFSGNAAIAANAVQERIIVEGQEVVVEGPLTERERANLVGGVESDAIEDARNAERAGIRVSRIELTGASARSKQEAHAREKARADSNARTQHLLALQAQLEAYQAEAGIYRGMIDNFEVLHFSAEQRARFEALPEEDRFAAKDQAMREFLQEGKITKQEYEDWRNWHAKEADALRNAKEVKEIMTNGTPEQIEAVTKKFGAATSEAAAENLDAPKREVIDEAIDNTVFDGNAAQIDDSNAFSKAFGGLGSALAISFANDAAPETPLRENAPALQTEFATKAKQETEAKPDAKVDLIGEPDPEATPPSQGM